MEAAETRALAERYDSTLTSSDLDTAPEHPMVGPRVLDAFLIDHGERCVDAPEVLLRRRPQRQHR